MDSLKVSTRLLLLTGVLTLLLVVMGALGLWGAHSSQAALRTVYEDRAVPLGQLAEIQRREADVQLNLLHAMADPDETAPCLPASRRTGPRSTGPGRPIWRPT